MGRLSVYLRRDGDCRAMLEFYRNCLGGKLELTAIRETPVAKDFPEPMRERVMHATLSGEAFSILGTDIPDPAGHRPGNDFALSVECSDPGELEQLFARLSDGGAVHTPPGPAFWGGTFAMCTDRFDIDWMLNSPARPGPS